MPGMNIAAKTEPLATNVEVTDEEIIAHLDDGRTISVPLAWSWRLCEATPEERKNFRLIAAGQGIHWPDLDEDISVQGMLGGIPARPPSKKDP